MNIIFMSVLKVAELSDEEWILLDDFKVSVDDSIITVPAGFKTDFASVPRLPYVYAMFGNRAHRPAVIHDFLYSVGGSEIKRLYADHVFMFAMQADGISGVAALNMFLAVREFGASHWNLIEEK